jgi:hypothetical protein
MIWSQNDNMGLDGRPGQSVRFWAGINRANRANAPFKVYDDGRMEATGATITGRFQTSSGQKKIVLDSADSSMRIFNSGGEEILFIDFANQISGGYEYARITLSAINGSGVAFKTLITPLGMFFSNSSYGDMTSVVPLAQSIVTFKNLPTNSVGLDPGTLWRDGTNLRVAT